MEPAMKAKAPNPNTLIGTGACKLSICDGNHKHRLEFCIAAERSGSGTKY
jgi:hypothetical protein